MSARRNMKMYSAPQFISFPMSVMKTQFFHPANEYLLAAATTFILLTIHRHLLIFLQTTKAGYFLVYFCQFLGLDILELTAPLQQNVKLIDRFATILSIGRGCRVGGLNDRSFTPSGLWHRLQR
jgi:hypothetical protein